MTDGLVTKNTFKMQQDSFDKIKEISLRCSYSDLGFTEI